MTPSSHPSTNRVWTLARRPKGDNFDEALELTEGGPIPTPGENQILVRAHYFSMDAGTRMWMGPREDGYQPPIPVGAPMNGMTIAEVVETKRSDFAVGDMVRCFAQWADYSVVDESAGLFQKLNLSDDLPLPAHLAMGGPNGWTALAGIRDVAEAKPGDVVLVSAAAGATGSLAGQVAKNLGSTVIGLTSRDEKCKWLTDDLGFDAAINYRTQDLETELKRLAPDGIDVYFDNVGGDVLDTVMGHLAMYARIAVCGLVAQYADDGKRPGPENFDQILMRRATVRGFFSPDWFGQTEEMEAQILAWYRAGIFTYNVEFVDGLENILTAYQRLFDGANRGKVMVRV